MIAWLVTDLPEPDSPTMPSVRPASSSKLMPSTDLTRPSSVGKWTCRSSTTRNGTCDVELRDVSVAGLVVIVGLS